MERSSSNARKAVERNVKELHFFVFLRSSFSRIEHSLAETNAVQLFWASGKQTSVLWIYG